MRARLATMEQTLHMYRGLTGIVLTPHEDNHGAFVVTAVRSSDGLSTDDTVAAGHADFGASVSMRDSRAAATFVLGPCVDGDVDELEYTPLTGCDTLPEFLQA